MIKNYLAYFIILLLSACNESKTLNKEKEEFTFYLIRGDLTTTVNSASKKVSRIYKTDSIYFNELQVSFGSEKVLDTLQVQDSLINHYKFIYAQRFDLDESIPLNLEEYDIDNEMDIFISEKNDDSFTYFLKFGDIGKTKQVFILHETYNFPWKKDSLRMIETYSIFMDTITIKKDT